ncbi:hypothetical protein S40288_07150 [Stachybotrys chartarum IBT 40288]|nr:hypothetical protein S40288_07150 [Stachybotrys chartarum IBT 40288]
MAKVLLTGGSGFIGAHVLKLLLERGYHVVLTVRSEEQGKSIISAYPETTGEALGYTVVKDIGDQAALDQAVQSQPPFRYVIHMASPFTTSFTDPVKEILEPAIQGTVAVLKAIAAHAPSVERVVITSSLAAIVNPRQKIDVYDESSWNPVTMEEASSNVRIAYAGSKALAERAAWDFVNKEKPNFDLVAINPPLVFGPILKILSVARINTSNQRIYDMLQGRFAGGQLPPTGVFLWADVRDVAASHVNALEIAEAGGQRFLVTAGHFSNKGIAEAIVEKDPTKRSRLPVELVDDTPADVYGYNNDKATGILKVEFRSFSKSINDTINSLITLDL